MPTDEKITTALKDLKKHIDGLHEDEDMDSVTSWQVCLLYEVVAMLWKRMQESEINKPDQQV